jgi:hypothetical protein
VATQTSQPAFATGQLVDDPAMTAVQNAARNLVGSSLSAVIGLTSANVMDAPFTVTASGGMNITAGGSGGQKVLINSASGPRLVDSIPTQVFTVPTADVTNPRHDILCGTYAQTQILTSSSGQIATINVSPPPPVNVSSSPIYDATEALTYTYVTGTPGSSPADPAAPSGSVALARIAVPALATSIVTGNITSLLTPAQTQILSGVAGFVDLTSNQPSIGGNKVFTGVVTLGGIEFAYGNTPYSGVAGVRLNTTGAIFISPTAPANYIALGYDCLTLSSVNFGPLNAWSYINNHGFCSLGADSVPCIGWPSNNGSNQTVVGCNSGSGYSGFSIALLNSGGGNNGSFIRWLIGSDTSGNVTIPSGHLKVGTIQLPTVFSSSDSSVLLSNSGGTLQVTLPSGFVSSFGSSDSSVTLNPSTRHLDLTLPSGFISSFGSSDSSIVITQSSRHLDIKSAANYPNSFTSSDGSLVPFHSGRSVDYLLYQKGGTIPPVYSQSGGQINSNLKIVTGQTLVTVTSTVTLSGNAVFTSTGSYQVVACSIFGSGTVTTQVNLLSGSAFTLTVTGPATVSWIAIGY